MKDAIKEKFIESIYEAYPDSEDGVNAILAVISKERPSNRLRAVDLAAFHYWRVTLPSAALAFVHLSVIAFLVSLIVYFSTISLMNVVCLSLVILAYSYTLAMNSMHTKRAAVFLWSHLHVILLTRQVYDEVDKILDSLPDSLGPKISCYAVEELLSCDEED